MGLSLCVEESERINYGMNNLLSSLLIKRRGFRIDYYQTAVFFRSFYYLLGYDWLSIFFENYWEIL